MQQPDVSAPPVGEAPQRDLVRLDPDARGTHAPRGTGAPGLDERRNLPLAQLVHLAVETHPGAAADVLAGLGWSVFDEHDLVEYLQRVVDLAVRVIGGATSAGVTAHVGGTPFTAVATDDRTFAVDTAQYNAGDGPCLHAMTTGDVVHVDLPAMRRRWPGFAPGAATAGVRAVLAAPLSSESTCLGALNLYATEDVGFRPGDAVVLQLLTAQAERSISDYARLRASEDLVVQLREAMASRAPIEQAKGILMVAHGLNAEDAFELLRTRSQHTNTKLAELARTFVAENSGGGAAGRPDGA